MKKLVSLVLALPLVLALSVTAFAAETTIEAVGEQDIDVQAMYQDSTVTGNVYSVDIAWGTMQFTFTESGSKTWNPNNHSYTENTTTGWTASGNTVTVTNHSNVGVTASFGFEALTAYNTVIGSFDVASKALAAGVVDGYDDAESVTAKLTLAGTLAESVTSFTKVGTITVTIV